MPNHVTNILKLENISKKEFKEIAKFMHGSQKDPDDGKASETLFDFNKIISMPEELSITDSSLGTLAQFLLFGEGTDGRLFSLQESQRRFKRLQPEQQKEAVELALRYNSNQSKFNSHTWYDWCRINWGTKWNSYKDSIDEEKQTFRFDTAYATPLPVIKKFSEKFPKAKVILTYADENIGHNCGTIVFQCGNVVKKVIPDVETLPAYKLALETKGRDTKEILENIGEYTSKDLEDNRTERYIISLTEIILEKEDFKEALKCADFYSNDTLPLMEQIAVEYDKFDYAEAINKKNKEKSKTI